MKPMIPIQTIQRKTGCNLNVAMAVQRLVEDEFKTTHETQPVEALNEVPNPLSARVSELEQAIVNLYRLSGSKRCAKECQRVLPDVAARSCGNL